MDTTETVMATAPAVLKRVPKKLETKSARKEGGSDELGQLF